MASSSSSAGGQAKTSNYWYGLARVTRQASKHPEVFEGYLAHHCKDVSDVPLGHIVYCLPCLPEDVGWRPIIVTIFILEVECARFGWIHPECIEPIGPNQRPGRVSIEHTNYRSRREPSISFLNGDAPGIKIADSPGTMHHGDLVLDCRWKMRFPNASYKCTGHCLGWCKSVILSDKKPEDAGICFATILRFADEVRLKGGGRVCCERGTHRSVAAGNLLMMLFNVVVDFHNASEERSERCCRERAIDNFDRLGDAMRDLPKIPKAVSRPLADILRLPESGDYRARVR